MTKCGNPDCERNHDVEAAVADVTSQAAMQIAAALDGQPSDAVYGLAQATMSALFGIAVLGKERAAFEKLLDFMHTMSDRILDDNDLLAAKAAKEAEGQTIM